MDGQDYQNSTHFSQLKVRNPVYSMRLENNLGSQNFNSEFFSEQPLDLPNLASTLLNMTSYFQVLQHLHISYQECQAITKMYI